MKFDWLIAGAGFSGAVIAERVASQLGQRVLVVDRRDHIGGNAFDHYDEHGVLIQKYGPHLFHTNDDDVWAYLSQFTEWNPYSHHVQAWVEGKLIPLPFNLNSIAASFPEEQAKRLEAALVHEYGYGSKVTILKLREHASEELKFLADYIYKNVFENYTLKQWGLLPEQLGPGVTGRVPVVVSHDNRYFHDRHQATPREGFTALFERMLNHKNITVLLNTDFRRAGQVHQFDRMVYTGAIDSFFDYRYGRLPYRSLRFEWEHYPGRLRQPVMTVNFPNDFEYTRTSEFGHLYPEHKGDGTTLVTEYPEAHIPGQNEAYYPVPQEQNQRIFDKYAEEAKKLDDKVIFVGRLADYKYYNMDQAVARALMVFEKKIAAAGAGTREEVGCN